MAVLDVGTWPNINDRTRLDGHGTVADDPTHRIDGHDGASKNNQVDHECDST